MKDTAPHPEPSTTTRGFDVFGIVTSLNACEGATLLCLLHFFIFAGSRKPGTCGTPMPLSEHPLYTACQICLEQHKSLKKEFRSMATSTSV
jgi:hypothetical protein